MNFKAGTSIWTWDRCYGRDGRDLPSEMKGGEALAREAINVELNIDGLPARRPGSSDVTFTNVGGGAYVNGFRRLGRYYGSIPRSATPEEYIFISGGIGNLAKCSLGVAPTAETIPNIPNDGLEASGFTSVFCQFAGKMYLARASSYDRLHVFDPRDLDDPLGQGLAFRRVGIGYPWAPNAANSGAGGYPAQLRYYRLQFKVKDPTTGITLRQSMLGTPVGFTPSGTGSGVSILYSAEGAGGEYVSHWVVWASTDNALYYNISGDIVNTGAPFLDTVDPAAYLGYDAAPDEGAYACWPSVKYLLSGIDRLIGFGSWGGSDAHGGIVGVKGRVYFSPVAGTGPTDDDERVSMVIAGSNPIQGYIDVGRGTGAEDRGLGGPIDGHVLVFQSRGVYLLVPTGNAAAPFKRTTISTDVGAIEGSIFTGQDEIGRPCVYWVDETAGPYRYGADGLQWLGYDVRDVWMQFNRTAPENLRAHGVFHNETQTAMFWITLGGPTGVGQPNVLLKFNARYGVNAGPTGIRRGWTQEQGLWANALHSVIARRGVTSAANGIFQPFTAAPDSGHLYMRDRTMIEDVGSPFHAAITSKVIPVGALFQVKKVVVDWAYLQALRVGTSLQVSLLRNYNDQNPLTQIRALAPPLQGSETRVLIRCDGLSVADAYALQVRIQDAPPVGATWVLDYFAMPIEVSTQERWNPS